MTPPTTATTEEEPVAVAAVKLSPFSATDAVSWFQRAEIQFRLKKVTNSGTKADHVLAALPEDIFPLMSDWIAAQPEGSIDYSR